MSMGGGTRIVMYVLDRSPSMEPVADLLLKGFNNDLISAIQEARGDDISALRIGGLSFSSDLTPIWEKDTPQGPEYFHKLEELPALTTAEYDVRNGCGTALHAAILEAYARAIAYAAIVKGQTGTQPEIDIIVLTDGQNNERPIDPASLRTTIQGSRKDLVRFTYFYFDTTGGGASDDEVEAEMKQSAKKMGFDVENVMIFAQKKGEDAKAYKSRFRRMLRVMSKVSASKGTSAIKAGAAVAASAAGDDDII
jgi:hypothetical protein